MGFSRQEHWSGLPYTPPEDLPNLGIKPVSPMSHELASRFFTTSTSWEAPWPVYWSLKQSSFSLPLLSLEPNYTQKKVVISPFSVQFSHSVVSNSLRPHEPQYTKHSCPSPTPRVHPNSCPLSWWCHPTISSCHPLLLQPSIFPSIRVFSNESALCIR